MIPAASSFWVLLFKKRTQKPSLQHRLQVLQIREQESLIVGYPEHDMKHTFLGRQKPSVFHSSLFPALSTCRLHLRIPLQNIFLRLLIVLRHRILQGSMDKGLSLLHELQNRRIIHLPQTAPGKKHFPVLNIEIL